MLTARASPTGSTSKSELMYDGCIADEPVAGLTSMRSSSAELRSQIVWRADGCTACKLISGLIQTDYIG